MLARLADHLEHVLARWSPRVACPLRSSRWTPSDGALVTGPGTPMSGRCRRAAQVAVLSAPLRRAASTTTVPRVSAAISRLRDRNRALKGACPGGDSETTAPCSAMCSRISLWACG